MTSRKVALRGWVVETSVAIAALLAMSGCDASDRGGINGTVLRKDGTPLVGARVVARAQETGRSAYGTTDSDGRFELGSAEQDDGVAAGDYDVIVLEDRGDPDTRRPPTIAVKYRDPATSGINVTVRAGETQEMNLTLDPR
jgi:hypothetical protein